jgi:serine-type D-Ala-D-Ala carboxypeptidase (penicillin-binding protein 5/6)
MKQVLPTASMSKLLTLYVVLQAIKNGDVHWNDTVTINQSLHDLSMDYRYANVPLKLGHTYTIRQLYQAALYSENAATMALAYGVGGHSTQHFVMMMRQAAQNMDIHDAKIYTACGLTNGEVGSSLGLKHVAGNADNQLSARDMAIIAMNILKIYPRILSSTANPTMRFEDTVMKNWNWMIKGGSQALPDITVDGLKTGTSDTAQACFTGTAVKNGHRIITVVMGVPNLDARDASRFIQTQKLMKYVYAKYHYEYIPKGTDLTHLIGTLPVSNGKQKSVHVKTTQSLGIWLSKHQQLSVQPMIIKKSLNDHDAVRAPFNTYKVLATTKFKLDYLLSDAQPVDLTATRAVDKANIFVRIWRSIASWF